MKLRTLLAIAATVSSLSPVYGQVTDGLVRIGVLNDQSGLYADLSGPGSVVAAKMAVEDFGGKVLNAPVEIVAGDHQNKPDVGSGIARRWIENEKVDVIVDVPHSATALAVLSLTKDKKTPLLLSGPSYVEFTGKDCTPTSIHWTYDSYAMANGTARAIVRQGGNSWFFLTGDNAGSHSQEKDATSFVMKAGGTVVGSVRHPLNTPDFSSFLLQAQQSKAKVIGLANAGGDTVNAIKQANEFGIVKGGQQLAGLLMFITDVAAVGLEETQGLTITDAFYWDANEKTRAWSRRFMERHKGRAPTSIHAGVYSAVLHYLKAIQAAGTDDGPTVVAKMKELPVNDFFSDNYRIRADGRVVRDMYLLQVKTPQESKERWDLFKIVARIPGDEAFRPMEGQCPLAK